MAMEIPGVISIQKSSRLLCISRTQIYRLLERGVLEEVQVGDRRMVKLSSVERYSALKKRLDDLKIEINCSNP